MRLDEGCVPVGQFGSPDGECRAMIFRRADGFFGYAGERLASKDGYTYWRPVGLSGIYETLDAAEQAALAELPELTRG